MARMTGQTYKQERRKRGLTQVELAALLGVRQSTVSDRERGRREIAREAAIALRAIPLTETGRSAWQNNQR